MLNPGKILYNSGMLKQVRKTIFYAFAGTYLVLAPLVILYAFGYIFSPTNLKIIRTGIIYLSSAPAGANVYFEKSRYTKTTPVVLRDLLPGGYTIRLSLNRYEPWVQNVKVVPGEATVFDNILLVPAQRKIKKITAESYSNLTPIKGTGFIILSKGDKFQDQSVFYCPEEKSADIFPADSLLAQARLQRAYTLPQRESFILEGSLHSDRIYVWVKPDNGSIEIENITGLFPQRPMDIIWQKEQSTHLFSLYEGYANLLDIAIKAIYPRYLDGLAGLGLHNNSIYELHKDGVFAKSNYDKSRVKKIDYGEDMKNILSKGARFYNIDFLKEDTFLFSGENGSLIINRPPYYIMKENSVGYEYSPDSQRLLFWGSNKIGIAYEAQKPADEENAFPQINIKWVYLIGKNISQCFWVYQGSYVLFKDGNDVYLAGPSHLEIPHLSFITEAMRGTSISYNEETGCVYFLDAKTKELKSIELIPKKHLITNPFPELLRIGKHLY